MTHDRGIPPAQAYPLSQREAHAEQHIAILAALSLQKMEQAKSALVAATYGVPHMVERLKAIKAAFRNELSSGGEK
jgi:hypothetical protein